MAWAHVQSTGIQSVGSVASVSRAFGSNVTSGNAIIVGITSFKTSSAATFTVTDTPTNSYATATGSRVVVGTSCVEQFSSNNITGGACTVQVTPNASAFVSIAIAEYSGLDDTDHFDTAAGTSGTGTAPNSGNISTANNAELLTGVMTQTGSGTTLSAGATFTQRFEDEDASDMPIHFEDKDAATAGTFSANWTIGASRDWICSVASWIPAAGGGATKARPIFRRSTRFFRQYR